MKKTSLNLSDKIDSDLEDNLVQEELETEDKRGPFDWYFRPKSFERSGKLYESLGVRGIKRVCDLIGKIHGKKSDI